MAQSGSSPIRSASERSGFSATSATASGFPTIFERLFSRVGPAPLRSSTCFRNLHRRSATMSTGEQDLTLDSRAREIAEQQLQRRQLRIALYSPGIAGLGHMRRNLLIGQTLVRSFPGAAILMIAEARQACAFAMPARMDCLSL